MRLRREHRAGPARGAGPPRRGAGSVFQRRAAGEDSSPRRSGAASPAAGVVRPRVGVAAALLLVGALFGCPDRGSEGRGESGDWSVGAAAGVAPNAEEGAPPGGAARPDRGDSAAAGLGGVAIEVLDLVVTPAVTGEVAALYRTLRNVGREADTLRGVAVAGASRGSIHESVLVDGRMSMRRLAALVVAPGARIELRPGALHGMLEGLERNFESGDTVSVRLRFALAGPLDARAVVRGHAELEKIYP